MSSWPFEFVLDTGATLTCLDESLAKKLELPKPRGQVGIGAGVSSRGRIDLVQIDSLAVGSATASDLLGCTVSLGEVRSLGVDVQGLLGLNFLKAYRVTLDFDRQTLKLDNR